MSSQSDIEIRRALCKDIPEIMDIVADAVEGMNKAGNFQWSKDYPTPVIFEQDVLKKELYVAVLGEIVVGVMAVNQNHTKAYDELAWKTSLDYFGVHRLAVSKKHRGYKVAYSLLNHAESVAKEHNCFHMRIDTNSMNPKAQALFGKLGYSFVGEVNFEKAKTPFLCYEKIVD